MRGLCSVRHVQRAALRQRGLFEPRGAIFATSTGPGKWLRAAAAAQSSIHLALTNRCVAICSAKTTRPQNRSALALACSATERPGIFLRRALGLPQPSTVAAYRRPRGLATYFGVSAVFVRLGSRQPRSKPQWSAVSSQPGRSRMQNQRLRFSNELAHCELTPLVVPVHGLNVGRERLGGKAKIRRRM